MDERNNVAVFRHRHLFQYICMYCKEVQGFCKCYLHTIIISDKLSTGQSMLRTKLTLVIAALFASMHAVAQYDPSWSYKVTEHNNDGHIACAVNMCDYEIYPPNIKIKPGKVNPLPGETVCLMPGEYTSAEIYNVFGTSDDPITVMNCGGIADIKTQWKISKSGHLKIQGTGSSEDLYGIKIQGKQSINGLASLDIVKLSRDIELSYLDISAVYGTTGIHWNSSKPYVINAATGEKTYGDPFIDQVTGDVFVQTGTHIHHNYIHSAREGEGIYVGIFGCDAQDMAHGAALENTNIHDNIVVDVGSDGIQVGCSREATTINNNYIQNAGYNPLHGRAVHTKGIQLGQGTTGVVFNNYLENIASQCFFVQGGPTNAPGEDLAVAIYNNIMIDCSDALIINQHAIDIVNAGQNVLFANNSIVNMRNAHYLFGPQIQDDILFDVKNNLHIDELPILHFAVIDKEKNLTSNITEQASLLLTADEAKFKAEGNYFLRADSPAVNSGIDTSDNNILAAIDGTLRDDNYDIGATEYLGTQPPMDNNYYLHIKGSKSGRIYMSSENSLDTISLGYNRMEFKIKNVDLNKAVLLSELKIGLEAGGKRVEVQLSDHIAELTDEYQLITIPIEVFGFNESKLKNVTGIGFQASNFIGDISIAVDQLRFKGGGNKHLFYGDNFRDNANNIWLSRPTQFTMEESVE